MVQGRLGTLFVLVGPGGVGKNALMGQVLEHVRDLKQLPTATTRAPRDSEVQGIHHLFMTVDEFQAMIADGDLLEHQEVHPGKFYGVPRFTVEDAIQSKQDLIADIEFKGASIIREEYAAHSLIIFIAPPSIESLESRLRDRQSSEVDIRDRLNRMAEEMLYAPTCDYVVVNDSFEHASEELITLIQAFHAPETTTYQPHHQITFSVEVYLRDGKRVLVSEETQGGLQAICHAGEHPRDAVSRLLTATFGIDDINAADLHYGIPAGLSPVAIMLDSELHIYAVTYRFTYACHCEIPGFSWLPEDALHAPEASS